MSKRSAPQGTITCLFVDIEGSTSLAKAMSDAEYKRVIAAFKARIREHLSLEHGYEVDEQGDGFFATFLHARNALACSEAIQQSLSESPIEGVDATTVAATLRVFVRIGVYKSARELFSVDGKYVDREVNLASRIIRPAKGGQILVSENAYMEGGGAGSRQWVTWPNRRLRDFDEPETVYELLWDGISRGEPGEQFLPDWFRERSSYVPRPELESRILAKFSVKNLKGFRCRLVTLHGPGGIGKTRLAVTCCLQAMPLFNGAIEYVRLDTAPLKPGVDDARLTEFVSQSIGERFGLKGDDVQHRNLAAGIPSHELLLLLDNFESVDCEPVAQLISTLLDTCRNLHLLLTGRTTAKLDEIEQVEEIDQLTNVQARQLFLQRARLKKGERWEPTQADDSAIEDIVSLTEGHALAIEIIAAWSRYEVLTSIVAGLKAAVLNEFNESIPIGHRDGRHSGLRGSLAWSYNLLSSEQQDAFVRISIFSDSFTRDAARHASDIPQARNLLI